MSERSAYRRQHPAGTMTPAVRSAPAAPGTPGRALRSAPRPCARARPTTTCRPSHHRTCSGRAKLWCPRSSSVECNGRPNWKKGLVAALEYAIGRREKETTEEGSNGYWGAGSDRVWSLAEHAKKWIEGGRANESLCPNRPQGITEREEDRREKTVNKRTRRYQRVERTVGCKLQEREWTIAPNVPARHDEMERWREEVAEWIDQSYEQVDLDIQAIRECEGEPE